VGHQCESDKWQNVLLQTFLALSAGFHMDLTQFANTVFTCCISIR